MTVLAGMLRPFGIEERHDPTRCVTGYWVEGVARPFFQISDHALMRCEDPRQLAGEIVEVLRKLRHSQRAHRGAQETTR